MLEIVDCVTGIFNFLLSMVWNNVDILTKVEIHCIYVRDEQASKNGVLENCNFKAKSEIASVDEKHLFSAA